MFFPSQAAMPHYWARLVKSRMPELLPNAELNRHLYELYDAKIRSVGGW